MKSSILSIFTILAACTTNAIAQGKCNANDCYRAAIGTVGGPSSYSSRMSDCTSYQQCTVTPTTVTTTTRVTSTPATSVATITTTTTTSSFTTSVTTTTSITIAPRPNKRNDDLEERQPLAVPVTNCPSVVPAKVASKCSTENAFASACACGGVSKLYTTLPASTYTVTVSDTAAVPVTTKVQTKTSVVAATTASTQVVVATRTAFILTVRNSFSYDGNGIGGVVGGIPKLGPVNDAAPMTLYLDSSGYLSTEDNQVASEISVENGGANDPFTLVDRTAQGTSFITCTIVSGFLKCSTPGGRNVIQICADFTRDWCGPYLSVAATVGDGCEAVSLELSAASSTT